MKAVVARSGQLHLTDLSSPIPGDGQVLVRTLTSGICGSDLHALHSGNRRAELARRAGLNVTMRAGHDVVFGHEFCAEVIEYGPGTERRFTRGTRVISLPFAKGPGGYELVGYSNRFPGGFGQQMVLTEELLLEVPPELPSSWASMTEPLAVGVHAVNEADIPVNAVCMVIGCGPVGLAIVAALRSRGIGPILASDPSPHRRAAATKFGADAVIDPAASSPHALWEENGVSMQRRDPTGQGRTIAARKKAVVFECVGVPGMLLSLIEQVPPYARIIVVGVCQEADHIEPWTAVQKQIEFRFVFGYSRDEFAKTFDDIVAGRLDAKALISRTVGLSGVEEAFKSLRADPRDIKIVVDATAS